MTPEVAHAIAALFLEEKVDIYNWPEGMSGVLTRVYCEQDGQVELMVDWGMSWRTDANTTILLLEKGPIYE